MLVIEAREIADESKVVYSEADLQMPLTEKDREDIKTLIRETAKLPWWKESLVVGVVMVGGGFIVSSFIPAQIGNQTSGMARDIGIQNTSIADMRGDIGAIQKDVS
jgi:hypothetical protein